MDTNLIRSDLRHLRPLLLVAAGCHIFACLFFVFLFPAFSPPTDIRQYFSGGSNLRHLHWGLYPPFVNSWLNTILFFLNLYFATTLALLQTRVCPTSLRLHWISCTLLRVCLGSCLLLSFNLLLIMVVAVHSAWPGNKPFPFLWDFVADALRIPLGGLILYVATYWLRQRRKRWNNLRDLPWVAGFILFCTLAWLPIKTYPALLVGLISLVLTVLALLHESNRFTTDPSQFEATPFRNLLSSIPGLLILGLGSLPLLIVLLGAISITSHTFYPPHEENPADESETLFLRWDGTLLAGPQKPDSPGSEVYLELISGKKVKSSGGESLDAGTVLLPPHLFAFHTGPWRYRLREMPGPTNPKEIWYLVHDGKRNGHALLVGFDVRSGRQAGYMGKTGYSETTPPASQHFSMERSGLDPLYQRVFAPRMSCYPEPDWMGVSFIWAEDGIYRIDITRKEVASIVEWGSGEKVLSVCQNSREGNSGSSTARIWRVLACTSRRVVAIRIDGTLSEVPMPVTGEDVQHLKFFDGYETGPVLDSQSLITNATHEVSVVHRIFRFNQAGILDTTYEVTIPNH